MKHFFTLIITLLSLLSLNAQTTLYIEDFENSTLDNRGQNGTTYNMAAFTNWTIDVSNGDFNDGNGDCFKQNSTGAFRSKDSDAPSQTNSNRWYSTVVNIAGYTNVTLSVDLIPDNSSSSNYVRFYYKLDAGAWMPIGAAVDGNDPSVTRTLAGLTGSTVEVKSMGSTIVK